MKIHYQSSKPRKRFFRMTFNKFLLLVFFGSAWLFEYAVRLPAEYDKLATFLVIISTIGIAFVGIIFIVGVSHTPS